MRSDPGEPVENWCPPASRKWLLTSAVLASALGFIDGSVVSIALPAMRADLGATLVQAQWISGGYILMVAALILTGGALSDRFGMRAIFGGGIALFVLASGLCAIAPTAPMLIAARVVQGVGAALMVPGSLALISRAYPPEERNAAIGTWAAASAVTTALGPIIGSIVLTYGGDAMWRLIFAINLPLGAIALWLLLRHAGRRPERAATALDWLGSLLATAALFCIAWGLSGGEAEGGQPSLSLPWAVAGLILFAVFLWHEARHPAPMLPLSLFRIPVFSAANGVSFVLYFALTAMMFFLPMAVIGGWGATAIDAALAFAPLSVFISTLSGFATRQVGRYGPGPVIGLGAVVLACGYAWVSLTAPAMSYWTLTMPGMVVAGLGMALVVAPLSAAVMGSVGQQHAGIASGVNNAVSRMSSVVAVAAAGTLAAAAYGAAAGQLSFGEIATDPIHAAASATALRWISGMAAIMAALSALVAFVYMRGAAVTVADQASSSASQ